MTPAAHRIRQALDSLRGALDGLSDGALLDRFVTDGDEAAFARLVRTHGPMVLGVCRRVLRHAQDAEDAFQATFLILARKGHAVARRDAVGAWLYRVAYRTAQEARAMRARRRAKETQTATPPQPAVGPAEPADWHAVLDDELSRLPAKYQAVVVLCDLEDRTRRDVARQLGIPEGTVCSRLSHGRRLLATRLARRGVTLGAAGLAVALAGGAASAEVAGSLAAQTAAAAVPVAAGNLAAVPTPVAALMKGVLKAMLFMKLKTFAGLLTVAALAAGVGGALLPGAGAQTNGLPQKALTPGGAKPAGDLDKLRQEYDQLKRSLDAALDQLQRLEGERAKQQQSQADTAAAEARRSAAVQEVHAALKRLADAKSAADRRKAGAALDRAVVNVKAEFGVAPPPTSAAPNVPSGYIGSPGGQIIPVPNPGTTPRPGTVTPQPSSDVPSSAPPPAPAPLKQQTPAGS